MPRFRNDLLSFVVTERYSFVQAYEAVIAPVHTRAGLNVEWSAFRSTETSACHSLRNVC